jgi:hypothetical protein
MTDKVVAIVVEDSEAENSYFKLIRVLLNELGWEVLILTFPQATDGQPNDKSTLPLLVENVNALIIFGLGRADWFVNHLERLNKPTLYATTLGYPMLEIENLTVVTLPCPAEDVVDGFTRII